MGTANNKNKIILIGRNGYLAKSLTAHLLPLHTSNLITFSSLEIIKQIQTQTKFIAEVFDGASLIICAGPSRNQIYSDGEIAFSLEEKYLSLSSLARNILYFSTADVYAKNFILHEDSPIDYADKYGLSRFNNENIILRCNERSTFIRTQTIWGGSFDVKKSYISLILDHLQNQPNNSIFENFLDGIRSPIHVKEICRVVESWINEPFFGVFNLSDRPFRIFDIPRFLRLDIQVPEYKGANMVILNSDRIKNHLNFTFEDLSVQFRSEYSSRFLKSEGFL